jgi:hypothetical protein
MVMFLLSPGKLHLEIILCLPRALLYWGELRGWLLEWGKGEVDITS